MKVEKVLRFHLLLLPIPKLTCKVNLNTLIRCYVYYISAQVADFMSSVGREEYKLKTNGPGLILVLTLFSILS